MNQQHNIYSNSSHKEHFMTFTDFNSISFSHAVYMIKHDIDFGDAKNKGGVPQHLLCKKGALFDTIKLSYANYSGYTGCARKKYTSLTKYCEFLD